MPRFLLLRRRPSSGVWKTEENCTSKRHTKWEANPSLSELISWPLFFLHQFLRFVLPLLLHHSGKLAIPRDHLFLLLQILYLFLFKCCSTKAIWESLEIVVLYYGGIDMEIAPIISEESWYTICSERICCNLFSAVSFEKLSSSCCNNTAIHWPCRWVDGSQCKCKHWFLF